MSVLMTFALKGDPAALERYASEHKEQMASIAEAAKGAGLIAHRFFGSDDGRVMVVDEWPDHESFEKFFGAQQSNIQAMVEGAGASPEGSPSFWRELESHDKVGWNELTT